VNILILAGSRDISNVALIEHEADRYTNQHGGFEALVSGMARGPDRIGAKWAEKRGIHVIRMTPLWDPLNKRAGWVRNVYMAQVGSHLLAFWDGESRGTRSMIDLAEDYDLETRVVEVV
jgi:hypothetical protein